MTEAEAKTKWCPQARVLMLASNIPANRIAPIYHDDPQRPAHGSFCLASGCMMWRWSGTASGYCGLAGAPGREP